jgi:hypothetical protein
MTNANFRRTLVGAAVAAALGVLATPASAAPFRGTFDPTNFSGEYTINVSAGCLAQANGWYANAGICSATLLDAQADVTSSDVTPNFNGHLRFAPPVITSPSTLFGLYVYGGAIDSFDTTLIHHNVATSDATPHDWWIQFTSGHRCYGGPCVGPLGGPTDVQPEGAPGFDPRLNGVYLYGVSTGAPLDRASYLGPAVDIGGAVPEPGTLSLLLGALGGGWLARRRRKEKVPDPN